MSRLMGDDDDGDDDDSDESDDICWRLRHFIIILVHCYDYVYSISVVLS